MMAYDRAQIFEKAKQVIIEKKLIYMEEVISFLPISKPTFYDFFEPESNELNLLKELIEQGKTERKQGLREKWYEGENATTQLALYKLLGTEEEAHRLNGSKQELKSNTTNTNFNKEIEPDYSGWTEEALIEYRDLKIKERELIDRHLPKGE